MIADATLQERARAGFATLKVSGKYVASALKWLAIWMTEKTFAEYVPQIRYLIEAGKWDFLLDSFYQVIPFGTGGRRGPVGIGPNRINTWTIQASAQGHSQYLIQQFGEEAKHRGVVLTFDVRKYSQKGMYNDRLPNPVMDLNGHRLALAAAQVYTANGIKVYMFDSARSTPLLSYAIRRLNAISGDMFSASHNLPPDNGKKVYDQYGGQLIPPHDQILVDEVTQNVSGINTMEIAAAEKNGLIEILGEEMDTAYHQAVFPVSLSDERDVKIVYSPLHGTGLTSVYPVLKKLGFKVSLDPRTSNLSGAFENVTFNIPNPEVIESFDNSLPFAKEIDADILMSSDPDADRIGVMVNHKGSWQFLTGNEIAIILTQYAISKYNAAGRLNPGSVVIKTDVTTSLMQVIAQQNGVTCAGDLLVGFKYIADVINKIEQQGKIDDFIFGAEESHGYLAGNYARDKDAACAAVWIAEHAAELKKKKKTLLDDLNEIYSKYGYCHNYLTEIRLLGAKGMEQIANIMDHFRATDLKSFEEFAISRKIDRWQGEPQPHRSETDTAARNILTYYFEATADKSRLKLTVRPSGTEPKIKMYFEVFGKPCRMEALAEEKEKITAIRRSMEKTFMQYCYKLLDVDFPDRGFLLFWQLPLDVKLKYFEIEDAIVDLKNISDKNARREKLAELLLFLGTNPIEKIDRAFQAKYQVGVLQYLDLH
jgi:phosphoglucomutase/phosphomannomutase